jgi:hypothetical protein
MPWQRGGVVGWPRAFYLSGPGVHAHTGRGARTPRARACARAGLIGLWTEYFGKLVSAKTILRVLGDVKRR